MYQAPNFSPWGEVQHADILCSGVFLVSTSSHGGIMVTKELSSMLSPAALKHGFKLNGFICYEEDCDENIVFRELLDKKLWSIPERIKDKEAFEGGINKSLQKYNPDYWHSRERGRANMQAKESHPIDKETR